MDHIYGLDFGTSNSSIAIANGSTVNVLPIDPTAPNQKVASSVLYVEKSGQDFIGAEAIKKFVEQNTGREVRRQRVATGEIIQTVLGDEYVQFDVDLAIPGRFFQALKTFLKSESFEGTKVFGGFLTLEQLISKILSQMKARADAIHNRTIDAVVMGRPVFFSDDPVKDKLAQDRLSAAAKLAGFRHIDFLFEPIGAALAYEANLESEKVAFVFDFGGGTLDFTIIRVGPERIHKPDRAKDVLAVGGVVIGGDTFDEDIMERRLLKHFGSQYVGKNVIGPEFGMPARILSQLRSWYTIPMLNERETIKDLDELVMLAVKGKKDVLALLSLIQKNYGWELFQAIEKAKIALSTEAETHIVFNRENIDIVEELTRQAFEGIISKHLRLIKEEINRTIQAAGLQAADIDIVIQTGGSSLIPIVQQLLREQFGIDKVYKQEVFTSVVTGLALAGKLKFSS
jgi:hypothetical chaperone protein